MMKLTTVNNVKVPVYVVLGGNELTLDELGSLAEGSIIELTSLAGEPVDLYASGEKIGEGEVVIIDENFGLRVTMIVKE
jgi:flagellar motor switch protein FliN/FliY